MCIRDTQQDFISHYKKKELRKLITSRKQFKCFFLTLDLARLHIPLNGRTHGSLARSIPCLYPTGYRLQLTFRLKTWRKWHPLRLILMLRCCWFLLFFLNSVYVFSKYKGIRRVVMFNAFNVFWEVC